VEVSVPRTARRSTLRAVLSLAAVGATLVVAPTTASAAPVDPPVSASGAPSQLHAGDQLVRGEELVSPNGLFHLLVEDNSVGRGGALTISGPPGPIWGEFDSWASTTFVMQGDGNFVGYDINGQARWATGTGVAGSTLVLQDDGNLVIYRPNGTAVWASKSIVAPTRYDDRALAGQTLNDMWSPNHQYQFVMQNDGNTVIYGPSGPVWVMKGSTIRPAIRMQTDGDLVAYDGSTMRNYWHSATLDHSGAVVKLQDDGNLVIYRPDGTPLWASYSSAGSPINRSVLQSRERLWAGQSLASPNGRYRLVMQGDGNVVEYGPAGAEWSTRTGAGGAALIMTAGGDAVVARRTERAVWHSSSAGNNGARLVVQDDGNVVVYRTNGTAAWASRTTSKPAPLPAAPAGGWWCGC
jgi:hypothetical protein